MIPRIYLVHVRLTRHPNIGSSSRHSASRDSLILPALTISLAIVAADSIDLGHGIIIPGSHISFTKDLFLEHRLWVNSLELSVEVGQTLGAAVGATPGIGERVVSVLHFVARSAPVAREIALASCTRFILTCRNYQLPLPPPSFFVLRGSASVGPDLAK